MRKRKVVRTRRNRDRQVPFRRCTREPTGYKDEARVETVLKLRARSREGSLRDGVVSRASNLVWLTYWRKDKRREWI